MQILDEIIVPAGVTSCVALYLSAILSGVRKSRKNWAWASKNPSNAIMIWFGFIIPPIQML